MLLSHFYCRAPSWRPTERENVIANKSRKNMTMDLFCAEMRQQFGGCLADALMSWVWYILRPNLLYTTTKSEVKCPTADAATASEVKTVSRLWKPINHGDDGKIPQLSVVVSNSGKNAIIESDRAHVRHTIFDPCGRLPPDKTPDANANFEAIKCRFYDNKRPTSKTHKTYATRSRHIWVRLWQAHSRSTYTSHTHRSYINHLKRVLKSTPFPSNPKANDYCSSTIFTSFVRWLLRQSIRQLIVQCTMFAAAPQSIDVVEPTTENVHNPTLRFRCCWCM